jgi:hypothetical protein
MLLQYYKYYKVWRNKKGTTKEFRELPSIDLLIDLLLGARLGCCNPVEDHAIAMPPNAPEH